MIDLSDLYRERAEYADIESDCDDAMKYVQRGGLLYRILRWVKRSCEAGRAEVQAEIDEIVADAHALKGADDD